MIATHYPTSGEFTTMVLDNFLLRIAYRRGWNNIARPPGELAGTENQIHRAWAMGRDDAFACVMDRGRQSDYALVSV